MTIEQFLSKYYDFRFNKILSRVEFKTKNGKIYKEMNDYELNSILRQARLKQITCSSTKLQETVFSNYSKEFHPYKDYMKNLPAWDGKDHIGELSKTIKTENQPYWETCLRKWLVGLVASANEDDKINHQVVVLVGPQGVGKSTWIKILLPKELRNYLYNGKLNGNDKDNVILLQQCLIINLEEFQDIKNKFENLKDLITKESTQLRRAYAKFSEHITQYASFIASTNDKQFLADETGNRRFLCHSVIDINYKHSIDMNKVFAQAQHLYKKGFKYWFDGEEIKQIEINNEKFQCKSEIEETICKFLEPCKKEDKGASFGSATEIIGVLKASNLNLNNPSPEKTGAILIKLGYERIKKKGVYGYHYKIK